MSRLRRRAGLRPAVWALPVAAALMSVAETRSRRRAGTTDRPAPRPASMLAREDAIVADRPPPVLDAPEPPAPPSDEPAARTEVPTRPAARRLLEALRVPAAYVVPALAALGVVQTWFRPGTILAAGDLFPPVARNPEFLSHWNHLSTGEGAAGYDITNLQYLGVPFLAHAAGLGPELAQRIWLTLLFGAAAVAVVFFARQLRLSPLAAGTASVLATFSSYRLTTGFDSIPLLATISFCLLGGLVVRAGLRGSSLRLVVGFAVASLLTAVVFVNPPHFALLLAWLVAATGLAAALGGPRAFLRAWALLVKSAPLALLLNLWWLAPVALTLTSPDFRERFAASGAESWTWTHERGSLANVLALNTNWAWAHAEYFPYAARLDGSLLAPLRFVPAALALLGLILAGRGFRRLAATLALFGVAGLVTIKGVHPPLGGVNRFLYEHVPGFWLFRDPAKVTLVSVLAVALLGGIAVARLVSARGRLRVAGAAAALAVIGSIAYVHPLLTGTLIAGERPLLPPAHVALPQAWFDAADYLDESASRGKVLVLPTTTYYQLPTTWGYYGASFTKQLVRRPVLEPTPGGYFRSAGAVSSLVGSVERDLVQGEPGGVVARLRALGVRFVLLRRDLDRSYPERRFTDPDAIARGLGAVEGASLVRSLGLLEVWEIESTGDEVYTAAPVRYEGPPSALSSAVRLEWGALVGDGAGLPAGATHLLRVERDRVWRVGARSQNGGLVLGLSDPLRVSLGDQALEPARSSDVDLGAGRFPAALEVGDTHFFLDEAGAQARDLGLVRLGTRADVTLWHGTALEVLDPASPPQLADCNRSDDRPQDEVGLALALGRSDGSPVLRLEAVDHAACVALPLGAGAGLYRVTLEYRSLGGAQPRVCAFDETLDRCAVARALDGSPGWHAVELVVPPAAKPRDMSVYLYADGTGSERTVAEYRRLGATVYEPGATRELALPDAVSAGRTAGGPAEGEQADVESPFAATALRPLTPAGSVGDCNRHDSRGKDDAGLVRETIASPFGDVVRLAARAHAACVEYRVEPFEASASYRLRLDYRRLAGAPPRVCVFYDALDRCARLPALASSPAWRTLDVAVRPPRDAGGIRLFLYADAAEGYAVSEYRNVAVSAFAPLDLISMTPLETGRPAGLEYRRLGSGRYRVRVTGAESPFLLVLAESFSDGWRLDGPFAPGEVRAHQRVNGYANAWVVARRGTYELTLSYAPARLADGARAASMAGAAGLVVSLLVGMLAVRVRRRRAS